MDGPMSVDPNPPSLPTGVGAPLDPEGLELAGIETVIVAAPDMQGRLFGRRMSPSMFLSKLAGIEVCTCTLAWDIEQDLELQVDFAGFHNGWPDLRLVPDLATLRPLGWLDGVALCFADVHADDGTLLPIAPRNLLRTQIDRLAGLGYEPFLGTELEFFLYRVSPDEARARGYRDLPPTTRHHADYLIAAGNETEDFFRRLRKGLEPAGVVLELGQIEWGLGQWEIGIRYDRALTTADAHVLFKMAVKDLAARDGMVATFMARPSTGEIGSSGHVHCSLRGRDGERVFHDATADDRLSDLYRWAVGGILDHAPEMMVWYAPTINSYRRVSRDELVAGAGCTWGYDNRTVSVRTIGDDPDDLRLEFRLPGADHNPYLTFAALLASIAEGIERRTDPGPPRIGNAYNQDRPPLPSDLGKAGALFRASGTARRWFGDPAVDHYAKVAEFEWDQFMAQVTDWEIQRYFEQI
jgi:glutamine synthetase